jgi:hypothetical protein
MTSTPEVLTEAGLARLRKGLGAKGLDKDGVLRLLATIDALKAENKAVHANYAARFRQISELNHAVDHALTCDAGTTLCRDCKRLLTEAREIGR